MYQIYNPIEKTSESAVKVCRLGEMCNLRRDSRHCCAGLLPHGDGKAIDPVQAPGASARHEHRRARLIFATVC